MIEIVKRQIVLMLLMATVLLGVCATSLFSNNMGFVHHHPDSISVDCCAFNTAHIDLEKSFLISFEVIVIGALLFIILALAFACKDDPSEFTGHTFSFHRFSSGIVQIE